MNEKKLVPITGSAVTGDSYKGEYIVTPGRSTKVLQTANKVLSDNVTVVAIPYVESTNSAGGKTVTIA